ncbi:MAG: hypothetical protein MO852_15030 [Candidatus Devosia euplotis]|nr:hypothetical protein [Candidatus Devosia euplotis]
MASAPPRPRATRHRIAVNVGGAKKFYEQYRMGSFFSDSELYEQVEVLRGLPPQRCMARVHWAG